MIKKLRLKFIAVNMGIVTIMLGVIFGMVFYFTRASLENANLSMMKNIASQPFQPGLPNMTEEEVRLPYFMLQVGPQGELIAINGGYYDLSDKSFLEELVAVTFNSEKSFGVLNEYNLRYYRVNTPAHQCLVFSDISSEIDTLDNLMRDCAVVGILSFFLFLGVSILLSGWAVDPVAQAWKQQRQFVADASHELKTPLTVIMTNAEMALAEEYSPAQRRQFLSSILTMSHQMKDLIEQLLSLVRADQAHKETALSELDFTTLVTNASLPFESVFFENGLELTLQIEEKIHVCGNEAELRQTVEILLDNAQKYAREKGRVTVTLKKRGGSHCLLTVFNEGEPIPAGELQNIFKRFYRIDQARSRSGSYGLGLSIAESIVVRHRGKIWAESAENGNSFHVLLPCKMVI